MTTGIRGIRDEVGRWLLELEERVDADGWDAEHALWLCSTTLMGVVDMFGQPLTKVTFTKQGLPDILEYRANQYLNMLVDELPKMPEVAAMIRDGLDGNLFAIALASETWTIPPQDFPTWRNRNWAEHPDRTESRCIVAVDRYSHRDGFYIVERKRGTTKVTLQNLDNSAAYRVDDGVSLALGRLLDLLATTSAAP